jgi:preprotein translocase subunit SecY
MELGISPVLSADYILDFLVGLKVIKCDMYLKED